MPQVKPVPENLHSLTPHITVKGAAKAIDYYTRAFGAQELSRHSVGELIMHAAVRIGDSTLFLNDEFPQMECLSPATIGNTAVTLTLYVEDVDAVFNRAVEAGGTVKMPVDDMFWGDRYGVLTDPFGHLWAIATRKENLTPEELDRRGKEAMAQMAQHQ